jgi:benzylsuccinate synthase
MITCKDCRKYHPWEEDPQKGDCIQKVIDPRQAFYESKPVQADKNASTCSLFDKK